MVNERPSYFSDSEDHSEFVKALAHVRRLAPFEGWSRCTFRPSRLQSTNTQKLLSVIGSSSGISRIGLARNTFVQ